MSSPSVSIIMNCYNGEKYIREAINSVIEQSYEDWELIIWDNRSTDNSAEIAQNYDDERIRYFLARTHTTLGAARISAARYVRGSWLAVLDVDDYWFRCHLKSLMDETFHGQDYGLIYSRYVVNRNEIGKKNIVRPRLKRLQTGNKHRFLLNDYIVGQVSAIYRKTAFDRVGGYRDYTIADYDLTLKISKLYTIRGLDKVTAVYRAHRDNRSRKTHVKTMFDDRVLVMKDIRNKKLRKMFSASLLYDYYRLRRSQRRDIVLPVKSLYSIHLIKQLIIRICRRLFYETSGIKADHRNLALTLKENRNNDLIIN